MQIFRGSAANLIADRIGSKKEMQTLRISASQTASGSPGCETLLWFGQFTVKKLLALGKMSSFDWKMRRNWLSICGIVSFYFPDTDCCSNHMHLSLAVMCIHLDGEELSGQWFRESVLLWNPVRTRDSPPDLQNTHRRQHHHGNSLWTFHNTKF